MFRHLDTSPRYLFFMLTLLLLLFLHALLPTSAHEGYFTVLNLGFLLIVLATVFASSRKLSFSIIIVTLGIPMVTTRIVESLYPDELLFTVSNLLGCLFFTLLSVVILASILKQQKVTANLIYGSISVYLLIGMSWTFIYMLIANIDPLAFSIAEVETQSRHEYFNTFSYYSYVVLSTLGFGDIHPINPLARTITYLEALVGQLYLTILIARFVGLHIAQASADSES